MHVKARRTAFAGLLLAFTVIFIALGSVIETNTLFLLAAASYFVGIVLREEGVKAGLAFYIAGVLLGLILSPNKFYVLSYAAMGLYIWCNEVLWRWLDKRKKAGNRKFLFWALKYIIFNIMYIPVLFGFQALLFGRELPGIAVAGALAAGQVGLFLYDRAYEYVQGHIWNRWRGQIYRS